MRARITSPESHSVTEYTSPVFRGKVTAMKVSLGSDSHPRRTHLRRKVTGLSRRRLVLLEPLEERRLLATLDIASGTLSYLASPKVANVLTISTTGRSGSYTFSDSAETITLTPHAIAAGWTGSGTHKVTGPDSSVTSITVDTGSGKDAINVLSVDAATTLAPTKNPGDIDIIRLGNPTSGVQAINGDMTIVNSSGTTVLTVDDSADSAARTAFISAGTIANLAPHPIIYAAGNVSALTIDGGGLFGTLNVSAGKAGPVSVTPGPNMGSGVITIGSTPPLTYSNFQAINITNAADQQLTPISQPVVTTTGDVVVEGKALSYLVAAFADQDPFAKPTGFVASINWGDGSPSAVGTIGADGFGNFNVSATHTYATDGSFSVTTTVTDTGASDPLFVGGIPVTVSDVGGGTFTTTTSVMVNDAVLRASVTNVSAVEGQTFNGVVATFNDDNPFPTPTDFTATIDWGDGSTSPGTIKRGNDPGNSFIVTGSHVYEDEITGEPPFILGVTISELNDSALATVQGTATVTDARLIPTLIQPVIAAVEGTLFSGPVATFTDLNVNAPLDDFNGPFAPTISWGDGQTSVGTVVKDVIPGQFDVTGSHFYAKDTLLPIPVIVTINDEGGMKATVNNTATVSDPGLTATAIGPITVTVGTALPAGTVITEFADPNPFAAAGDFRAGIDWGDGTPLTAGTVQQAGPVFNVIATHTYSVVNTFKTTVTIVDPARKVELVDDPEIDVVDAALTPEAATVFATEQVPFTANVATFTDADPFPDASKFSAKIDWGDGQTSAGTITPYGTSPSGMTFDISGSHIYIDNGVMNHQITVTVVDSEGSQTVVLSKAILGVAPAPTDPQGRNLHFRGRDSQSPWHTGDLHRPRP